MKRIIFAFFTFCYYVFLTACGSSSLNPNDLSIDSFDWETKQSKCGGKDCFTLSLSNKTKYDIIGVYFTYKVKSDTSKRDLRVYDDFMSEYEGYIDEDDTYQDITLIGQKNELIQIGRFL